MKKTIYSSSFFMSQLSCILFMLYFLLSLNSCKKYLDAKPDQSIATPSTIDDLEGILNNYSFINARYPSASEVSADDYYLTSKDWSGLAERQRNFYTWQKYNDIGGDYTSPYSAIEYANIILDALPKVSGGDISTKNMIEGNALFIRASYHYALAQIFAKAYDNSSANTDLGIAIRQTSDIQVKPVRSTVAETYDAILKDLKRSIPLLPNTSDVKYKASRSAAYGMLARVYLSMANYKSSGLYVDSALSLYSTLIDYNTVSSTATIPFTEFNDEVIYDSRSNSASPALATSRAKVDTLLYQSYSTNDLRKSVFFKSRIDGSKSFKGNYTGLNNSVLFTGIATDELYLIKAESNVRNGDVSDALQSINTLLAKRWVSGTYIPNTTNDPAKLLSEILQERRKELLFRELRWTDLRRLNKENIYSKTLYRNVNGATFLLEPGSLRYVLEIDQNAVNISGLIQNP